MIRNKGKRDSEHTPVYAEEPYNDGIMAGRPPSKDAPPFGQRLAALRKERGHSSAEFARLAGISEDMLTYYERRAANPNHNGSEDYNWFLGVLFPANQLRILPYNRLVKDLNGLSPDDFLARLSAAGFSVTPASDKSPAAPAEARLYLNNLWYSLHWDTSSISDPVSRLDVSVLQDRVLSPILAIHDPRTDDRIEFVGGIRGTDELERRVNDGSAALAFSLFPVTVDQLMDIADAGQIMPPKSTWFEPKLRSGLVIQTF